MKSKVILLVGPPLSGKDTYLKTQDYSDYVIISRDDILMSLHDTDDYSSAFNTVNQKEVDKILNQKIQDSIGEKRNVIINMTNLSKKSRNKHLCKFSNIHYDKIAIVFPKLNLCDYINRNDKRKVDENKFIPVNVIQTMIENWQEITLDEGFDSIIKL
jgi:predicted kinase